MGLLWFGGTVLQGVGEVGIGDLGAVIGFPIYTTTMVLTSNLAGIWQGEWSRTGSRAKAYMTAGLVVMLVAIFTIGMSTTFALLWVGIATALMGMIALVVAGLDRNTESSCCESACDPWDVE